MLKIAVLGGGIGGLAAALVLRKKHDVVVFERYSLQTAELGGAVGLGPNGTRMAKSMGLTADAVKAVTNTGFKTWNKGMHLLSEQSMDFEKMTGSPYWFVHREDLKKALLDALEDGKGNPVKIIYEKQVVDVDVDAGVVKFADGSETTADVVIGADGIHSKTRVAVLGSSIPPPSPINLSTYRFTISRDEAVRLCPELPPSLDYSNGAFLSMIVVADGSNRNIVLYPCRDMEVINVSCAVPDSMLQQHTEQSWTQDGSVEELKRHFEDFPAWIQPLISSLHTVKLFQIRDQDPLPSYMKGRTVLIGDAAHAMTPYQGQGSNQALEDAEGLSLLLEPDVTDDSVEDILKSWESVRRPRASEIQGNSRAASQSRDPKVIIQRLQFNWEYHGIATALAKAAA